MIKCEKGCVEIEGRRSEILAEFSCLVKGILEELFNIKEKKDGE